ncbi:MAG TPA: leucine-rich repeat domain-containing protein [Flavobacterium sp.]|nr:leucine-rich repeat domain-containing protein [Flavobacterium sp.]
MDLTGLINLEILEYAYNQLANLNLVDLPSLKTLNCSYNQLETLNVLNLTSLQVLICASNQLTTLNLAGLTNLITLDFSYNNLTLTNVSGLSPNLKSLVCVNNNLTSLDVSGLTSLETLNCYSNQLTSLDVSSLNNLKHLDIAQNQITAIDVSNLTQLEMLNCSRNQLTDIYIVGLNNLTTFYCAENQLTTLNLTNQQNLRFLDYSFNAIPNLDVSALTNLSYLGCGNTQSTLLDISNLNNLQTLLCFNNQLTTLNINNAPFLNDLRCSDNLLTTLFIKNGRAEQTLDFTNNPTLEYICADEAQLETIQTTLNGLGMSTTVSNSYCTFSPGGNHNTIRGIAIFDDNNDGCDATDVVNPFVRLNVNDGSAFGATVTNINGTYNFYTGAGTYTIEPNIENPTWFTFSPSSADFTFANDNNNISTQDFCIAAVGTHSDIEVVFTQLEVARPGFDARYKVVYKNKGNQMESGTINLNFDDNRTDFVSSEPTVTTAVTNALSWDYTNLMPFESRSIELILNINSPMESPAVNNGDILNFTATITPVVSDELPSDNQFTFNQTVLGSFDPNDIMCLEGASVPPTEIGEYLHYIVNFENTGTFYAENIVVRLTIDESKYDINSMQLLNTSSPSSTRITNNLVEFVFEGINLAAAAGNPPVGGHGNVLFKIKTKTNLEENDTVLQRAGIYFDYNFPIVTNDAETTFAALSNGDIEVDQTIAIYPNPTKGNINITSQSTLKSIELFDVQGRLMETHILDEMNTTIDITNKAKGIYFLKITSDNGTKVEKIIKE